jgi:PKD repeat protein
MKYLLSLAALLFCCSTLSAQEECGTEFGEKAQKYLEEHREQMQFYEQQYLQLQGRGTGVLNNIMIPIKAHILRRTNGSGGLSVADLNTAIAVMNTRYAGSGLEFFLCNGINFIDDDSYFDFDGNDESIMTSLYGETGMVNIYFANSVTSRSGANLCGYAYYPGGPETVLMANSCATNGSTLSHEVGHFFALVHTHGGSNTPGSTGELVDGSNCSSTGDFICDTPADPQLGFSNVNASCNYTGNARDANNQLYTPDPTNIMSYSRKSCRTQLTTQQFARVYAAYQSTNRNNLDCPTAVANFTADVTSSCQPGLTVNFTADSPTATSWIWDVDNDGTIDYTIQNPTHTYSSAGNYTVSLTASDGNITDTNTKTDYIIVGSNSSLASNTLTLELNLDNYPDETTWEFLDGNGSILYSGGPYNRSTDAGTTRTETFALTSNNCYTFSLYDSFSDGICCAYGNGSYRLLTSDGTAVANGGNFTDVDTHEFATGTLGVDTVTLDAVKIYPNPASDKLTVIANGVIEKLIIYDELGRVVRTKLSNDLQAQISLSNFTDGVYFLKVQTSKGVETSRFIKRSN